MYQRLLVPCGVTPHVQQVQLTEAIIELVKAGLGVAVLAWWAVEPAVRSGALRAVAGDPQGMPPDVERRDAQGHGARPSRQGLHSAGRRTSPVHVSDTRVTLGLARGRRTAVRAQRRLVGDGTSRNFLRFGVFVR